MSYAEALDALVHAAAAAGIALTVEKPRGAALHICETVFGPALAAQIADHGYPKSFAVPWVAEDLYFYGLDDLSDRQAGYRFHGHSGEPLVDWPADRFVIADWTADPVTAGQDGPICHAVHGAGSWTWRRIAADLPAFLDLLTVWIRYFAIAHGGSFFGEDEEDFVIPEEIRAEIRREVLGSVAETDRDAVIDFLLGE